MSVAGEGTNPEPTRASLAAVIATDLGFGLSVAELGMVLNALADRGLLCSGEDPRLDALLDVYVSARDFIERAGDEHGWQELASAVESYREVYEPGADEYAADVAPEVPS